jgi:hypothetical protein
MDPSKQQETKPRAKMRLSGIAVSVYFSDTREEWEKATNPEIII